MPVILGFIALVSGIAFFIWRARNAVDATREIVSTADDMRGKVHYWWFKRNYNKHPLQLIEDPREAAVAWMVALAQDDGALSEAELVAIRATMRDTLEISNPVEMLARARWATRDLRNMDACAVWLMPLMKRKLGRKEQAEFCDMLANVAGADGAVSEAHVQAIARWRAEFARG